MTFRMRFYDSVGTPKSSRPSEALMKLYQHNFDRVEDYLHHRAPYLLVKDVVSISDQEVITKAKITGDEFFIEGHFPGAPILPGAMMQEMTTQSAGILIAAKYNPMERYDTHDPFFNEYALGVLVKVKQARYRGFARPGDEIQITVRLNERVNQMFDFNATVSVGQQTIMRNSFQLTNIPSATLQGTESQTQP